jgi:putative glutamine amidotransferase
LIHEFYKASKPVLGICAGHQAINVAFGGSLNPDIKSSILHNGNPASLAHKILIEKNTILSEAVGKSNKMPIYVNSAHHQAVEKLGNGVRVSAKSEDGIVEAIEVSNHPFMVGVQWHPEFMLTENDNNVISAFCHAISHVNQSKPKIVIL